MPAKEPAPHGTFLQEIGYRFRLFFALLVDKRVGWLSKLLVLVAVAYVFNPFDLPSLLDDAVVLILLSILFVEMAPLEIVNEHLDRMRRTIPGKWREVPRNSDEVIDGRFIEPDDKKDQKP